MNEPFDKIRQERRGRMKREKVERLVSMISFMVVVLLSATLFIYVILRS